MIIAMDQWMFTENRYPLSTPVAAALKKLHEILAIHCISIGSITTKHNNTC